MVAPGCFRWVVLAAAIVASMPATARLRPVHPDNTPPYDVFSASEPAAIRTTHLALDLEVDFDARTLRGTATHTIVNLSGTTRFALDTRYLDVRDVVVDGEPAEWHLEPAPSDGKTLAIAIGPSSREVTIDYGTTVTNRGVVFMTPEETLGDTDPFLYTFGQPDKTREWIPVQDSPGIRMTYDATIRVPAGLMALMSARNPTELASDGVYRFEMPYPIPPYLIALAVGNVEFRALDSRTGFYAEPPVVDDATRELQYIPEMLNVAEELLGPYPFERYDIILTPPGYAAGGMENPMLNFIGVMGAITSNRGSPIAPTYLLAHEMAHSWAGDLATCATWSDTWLNEGFATYYGHRILGEMLGSDRSELGYKWEREAFEVYVKNVADKDLTKLHRVFPPGSRPSISSPTNYSKGGIFLQMLETRLGRTTFDAMMRRWFGRHRFRWVDELAFIDELRLAPETDEDGLRIEEWIYGTGLPTNVTAPVRSSLWDAVGIQASRFRQGAPASSLDTEGWSDFEFMLFLWQAADLVAGRMAELDAAFGFSQLPTPPFDWFVAMARTRYGPGLPMFERYLMLGGFNVIVLYQTLAESASGRAWGLQFYERARPHYVPAIRDNVDRILGVSAVKLRNAA